MAFKLYSTDDGHVPAWEYQTLASGVKAEVGLGLAFNGVGKLTASKTPTHICMMSNGGAVLSADTEAPVVAIQPDQIWETALHVRPDSTLYPGMSIGLADNCLLADPDNTTNAVFEITYIAGQAMGDIVRGKFVNE